MLRSIAVENYKCFSKSESIAFAPHMNVIIGKNNAGKSSLLSLMTANQPTAVPFRGPQIAKGMPLNPNSTITFEFELLGSEIKRAMLNGPHELHWPMDKAGDPGVVKVRRSIEDEIEQFFKNGTLTCIASVSSNSPIAIKEARTNLQRNILASPHGTLTFNPSADLQKIEFRNHIGAANPGILSTIVRAYLTTAIYLFRAERMNIGKSDAAFNATLAQNAGNLAQVIHTLREDRRKFDQFELLVRQVIPEIAEIVPALPPDEPGKVEIRTSMIGNLDRSDLQIALRDSGTGVSQVLAILYVVVTSEFPRLIIIDEPNSFLHPGAAKQIVRILKRFPQHQYILSTHSTDLIRTAEPEKIISIEWKNTGSTARVLDGKKFDDLRYMLSEVGAQLSDVMGPDKIIWVEGPTEENCFPLLLRAVKTELPPHVSFAPIRATGDLIGKHKKVFYEMYEHQTDAVGIVPIAIAYNLDSEGLTAADKDDLARASKGRVKFLPRHTYENYLLNPDAIESLFIRLGVQSDKEEIKNWMMGNGGKEKYYRNGQWDQNISDANWVKEVNAASLLTDLFSDLTKTTFEYKKIEFGVELTSWILKHDANSIQELANYVVDLVQTEN